MSNLEEEWMARYWNLIKMSALRAPGMKSQPSKFGTRDGKKI